MGRAKKGSSFERKICKRLSMWWSGDTRDDIFWRSSQSGGRATQRTKKGLKTYGSYGDIAAVDPVGEPLLKLFTIELKRGSSYGYPGDLLDFKQDNSRHKWVRCLLQAIRSHEQAGSKSWMLICRRDCRLPIVFLDSQILRWLWRDSNSVFLGAMMRMRLPIRSGSKGLSNDVVFSGLSLEDFLGRVTPKQVRACLAAR